MQSSLHDRSCVKCVDCNLLNLSQLHDCDNFTDESQFIQKWKQVKGTATVELVL